jgi:hypothetical protein
VSVVSARPLITAFAKDAAADWFIRATAFSALREKEGGRRRRNGRERGRGRKIEEREGKRGGGVRRGE